MRMKLRNGDYVADGAGGFVRAEGNSRILEQALFMLTARRGGFPLLPELGSRLYLLPKEKPSAWETMARTYIQEALEPMGLTVTDVTVTKTDVLQVRAVLGGQGEASTVEVTVQ